MSPAALSIVAFGLQRLASAAIIVGGSHILGSVEFGKFSLVYALCVYVSSVPADSLSATAGVYVPKKLAESENAGARIVGALVAGSICIAVLLSAAVFWSSGVLAHIIGKGETISNLYELSAAMLLFQIPAAVLNATLFALGRGRDAAICTGVLAILTTLMALLSAALFGVTGMCLTLASASLLGCATYLFLLPRQLRSALWRRTGFLPSYSELKFILRVAGAMVFTQPVHLICMNLLAASPNGLHETAVFSAFYVICSAFMFVPSALTNFILPHLAVLIEQKKRFGYTATMSFSVTASVSAAMMTGVLLTSQWIVLLFGMDFRGSATTLELVAAVGFTSSLLISANQLMWVTGKSTENLGITIAYAVCYVIATISYVVYSDEGSAGLAKALLTAQLLQLCMYMLLCARGYVAKSAAHGERLA
jgi:O-antigen/teichoic acid export membrane protein